MTRGGEAPASSSSISSPLLRLSLDEDLVSSSAAAAAKILAHCGLSPPPTPKSDSRGDDTDDRIIIEALEGAATSTAMADRLLDLHPFAVRRARPPSASV